MESQAREHDLFSYAEEQVARERQIDEQAEKLANGFEVPLRDEKRQYPLPITAAFLAIARFNESIDSKKERDRNMDVLLNPVTKKFEERFRVMKAHDEEERRKKYVLPKKFEVAPPPQVPQDSTPVEEEEKDFSSPYAAKDFYSGRRRRR